MSVAGVGSTLELGWVTRTLEVSTTEFLYTRASHRYPKRLRKKYQKTVQKSPKKKRQARLVVQGCLPPRSDDEASERVGGRGRGVRGGFACFGAAAVENSTNGFMKNLPLYIVAFAALLAVFVVP